jgi:hypothetical protein
MIINRTDMAAQPARGAATRSPAMANV